MKRPVPRCSTPWPVPATTTTRVILKGAYLDVSKPSGHYAVATDGRHLFASNSLHLALPSSVLDPRSPFPFVERVYQGRPVAVRGAASRRRTKAAISVWKAAAGRSRPSRSKGPIPTGATSPTMSGSLPAPSTSAIRRRKPSGTSCPGCRETTRPTTRWVSTVSRAGCTCAASTRTRTVRHRSRGARCHDLR